MPTAHGRPRRDCAARPAGGARRDVERCLRRHHKDAEFRAEIEATKLELDPMAGAELQALVEASTRVSDTVLARARAARAE